MSFTFKIESITHLASARAFVLDGILEEGKILGGSQAQIQELGVSINIKNVALVNPPDKNARHFTLSIEQPNIPLSQIQRGMTLIG